MSCCVPWHVMVADLNLGESPAIMVSDSSTRDSTSTTTDAVLHASAVLEYTCSPLLLVQQHAFTASPDDVLNLLHFIKRQARLKRELCRSLKLHMHHQSPPCFAKASSKKTARRKHTAEATCRNHIVLRDVVTICISGRKTSTHSSRQAEAPAFLPALLSSPLRDLNGSLGFGPATWEKPFAACKSDPRTRSARFAAQVQILICPMSDAEVVTV